MFDRAKQMMAKKGCRIVGYILLIVLMAILLQEINIEQTWNQIKAVPLSVFLGLLFLQICTQLLLALQWNTIIKAILQQGNFGKTLHLLTTGSVIEGITPGAKIGGEATRLYYLKKNFNCTTDMGVNIILIQKSISMSVLFTICVSAFIYLSTIISMNFSLWTQWIVIGTCISIIAFLLGVLFFTSSLIQLLEKRKEKFLIKLTEWVKSYAKAVKMLTPLQWRSQFGISIIVWLLFPIKMYFLTQSLLIDMNFFMVIGITMTAYMMGMLPLTPGGIGTFEGSMVALFILVYGNAEENISLFFTVAIVFRFITFWFVMLISLLYVIISQV